MPDSIIVNLLIDPATLAITGTVSIPATPIEPPPPALTQRGLDAVLDLRMDLDGVDDCSAILSEYLKDETLSANSELHFPPGRYRFNSTVTTNARNIRLVGDGHLANMGNAPVIFFTDQALNSILHWDGSQTNSNMNGPKIEGIQFQDTSPGHNQLGCAIRLTATANAELNVGFLDLHPRRYTYGTVTVQAKSKTVTGQGTGWTSDMVPGWMVIDGYPYEIADISAAGTLILAIPYLGPSANSRSYAINWGGIGVWLEPGTDFTQYGKDWSLNGRCGCALFASAGVAEPGNYTGTSRIKVRSGYLNGEGIPDSLCCYLGPYSDTFLWDVAMNSYAFGVVVANGHQHDLQHGDYENAGPPPPVTGLPLEHNSCRGILLMGSNDNDCWGNRIGGYFRQVGTAIELYGQPNYTVLGACTFRSNKANFVPGTATNTIGVELYANSKQWQEPPPCDEE